MPVDHGGGFLGLVAALLVGVFVAAAFMAGVIGFINLIVTVHGAG
jgi:hypothetical protein